MYKMYNINLDYYEEYEELEECNEEYVSFDIVKVNSDSCTPTKQIGGNYYFTYY